MQHPYAHFVHRVQKPSRYVGGELFQRVKQPADVRVSMCLTFPDVYDIGMSHLGTKILYKVLNDHKDIACERAFAPWMDMEAELRARGLPLVSLETARPLSAFDAIGFSLQYELTYTNVLTMLDLGGIPLRSVERRESDPLVLAGGPCATHPEAIAPFIDAFVVGDGEARLPELLLAWKTDREAGHSRREALIRMAAAGGVYVPSLYETAIDAWSQLEVVTRPVDERVPARVKRAFVPDINAYPFPDDSPVASAQAIFDRLSIEVARGCTEGCRFCQAGMIYRPVRERDPNAVIDTILRAVDKGGYDEASLTSLSMADYSCVDPLIRNVMGRLRERKVALSVSSLRAYGLNEGLLDEIRTVRATGLTFAPEAGTQRMRDVVNKNISEEDITASAHRIFSRGWDRMKIYFMIGLPTEEDVDVQGIVETTSRLRAVGRRYMGRRAEVVASVSSHVPKPHTPFQWAAMDPIAEIRRKQKLLGEGARRYGVSVKWHDPRISMLEGIVARGDRRVADVIELAWRRGCRFDGWDSELKFETWIGVLKEVEGFDPTRYLGTLPIEARLPWDHIDVGLEDGFLATEWKRTLKSKASPPCGKPFGRLIHHTNVAEAQAETKKLVCYDCGVACDLGKMREERIGFLASLGAMTAPAHGPEIATDRPPRPRSPPPLPPKREDAVKPEDLVRYRLQYVKTGLIRLHGHSDMLRILPRVLRRAQLPLGLSWGFHPKPLLSFAPALPLGTYSSAELVDVSLSEPLPTEELLARLNAVADPGLSFLAARCLPQAEPNIAHHLDGSDYVVAVPGSTREALAQAAMRIMGADTLPVTVTRKEEKKQVDARPMVAFVRLGDASLWPAVVGEAPDGPMLHVRFRGGEVGVRPRELLAAVLGERLADTASVVRIGFWRRDADERLRSPMEAPPEPADTAALPPAAAAL